MIEPRSRRPERVRFAPSPTGSLHLGNARTALFNWLVARQSAGTMILRIEDTDVDREEEGSEAGILEDLLWLGLDWQEGPDVPGPHGPYRQSERSSLYEAAARRLLSAGRAYRCFCTDEDLEREREEQRASGMRIRYSGRCRRRAGYGPLTDLPETAPHAVRFRAIPDPPSPEDLEVHFADRLRGRITVAASEIEDFVLLRRDGRPTYNFAVVVDDAAMEVTLVLRGDDHLSNTPRQVLLFRALGRTPPAFAHVPMVRGPDGERLSKRHGATSVSEYRRLGYTPAGLRNALALLGWSPKGDREVVTLEEMIAEFDLDRVSSAPAIFDARKLDWVSGQHIHRMPARDLAFEVSSRLIEAGLLPVDARDRAPSWLTEVAELVRSGIERFDQVPLRLQALFSPGVTSPSAEIAAELTSEDARRVVSALEEALVSWEGSIDSAGWEAIKNRVKTGTGLKGKALFHPIRLAVTGEPSGPELDRLVPLVAAGHVTFPEHVPGLIERVRRTRTACP